jgi:Cadherin domain.
VAAVAVVVVIMVAVAAVAAVAAATATIHHTITNSTSSYSAVENQTGAFLVTATDSDGDALTYSITAGADSSLFTINTTGSVSFNTAPDFEVPGDSNADNVYELEVNVSDGTASDSQAFTVTVTNDTSDDPVTSNYDGVLIRDGYKQSAICMYSCY